MQTKDPSFGIFDRFMFWLLRLPPLPIHKEKKLSGGVMTVLTLYAQSIREFPWLIASCILLSIAGSFASVLVPYIFKQFLDVLGQGVGEVPIAELKHITFLFAVTSLTVWAAWRACYFINAYFAARMLALLRQRSFGYLIKHSHQFFINTFAGSLVQRVNCFAQRYDKLSDMILYDILPIIVQMVCILYILLKEKPILALIVVAWLLVFLLWNYVFALWKLKYDASRAVEDSHTTAVLADAIANHQTIELYESQAIEEKIYRDATNTQSNYMRFSWQSSSIIDGAQALMIVCVQIALLYVGIDLWSKNLMTVGLFVLVQTYVLQLSDKLWSLSRVVRDVYEAFADAQQMADILTTPHQIQEKKRAKVLKGVQGEVSFKNVTFSYHGRKVLDGLNVTIPQGQKVALVGVSGAGKSTLIKLLFRQYDPDEGEVQIDGQNIKDVTLASLRNALSLVPQDPALFHRTLLENIRYGKQDATDVEVKKAALYAHCNDFISALPLQYDTLVGERGVKLSGGERQRVAIARAFLRNSPVLVLDEATSSLDSHSEERIQDSLMHLMEGKTTIIIAHRLSTIRRVDRILVMKEGVITEDGTHDELLKKKDGIYANLWAIQQGGFLVDQETTAQS